MNMVNLLITTRLYSGFGLILAMLLSIALLGFDQQPSVNFATTTASAAHTSTNTAKNIGNDGWEEF